MPTRRHRALPAALLAAPLATLLLAGLATHALPVQASPRSAWQAVAPRTIDMVFVLDTTGSMGGMLEGAKTKIWGIVNEVLQRQGNAGVTIRVGLVAYRDRGDAYLTKVTPLSDKLDAVYTELMGLRAEGGGDTPEDVRSAMADALRAGGWSTPGPRTSQIMFLVGDAPPHDDYQNLPSATASAREAARRGIIVNTIQCGRQADTATVWRAVAQYGSGDYFAIAQDGGVDVIVTPYDQQLSQLGEQIGATYLAYGAADKRAATTSAQAGYEAKFAAAAPAPALAERAVNKALNERAYDENDLVQKAEAGAVSLGSIREAELPDALRRLPGTERQAALDKAVAERKALRAKIVALSRQRDQYLAEQKRKAGGDKTGFDAAVSNALARQVK